MRICRIRVQSVTHFGDEAGLCLVLILTFFPQLALGAEKVLHWPFEQSFTDASPSNNRGEFTEGKHPRFVNGRFGSAIRLEPGELVTCKNGTNIPTAKGESWTINLWARLAHPLADGAILGGFGGRAEIFDDKRFIICFNESIYFWEGDGKRQRRDLDSETRFPIDGSWHMYTVMFDSSAKRLSLYIDANEIAVMQPVTTLADALPEASVGGVPDFFGQSFRGEIDEFAIWVGSLTTEQLQRLFAKNTTILPPPLWQRVWFVSLVSLLLGSGVTVGLRIKERRRQQRRIAGLERESALERERARIAQDIHDDLGAGLTRVGLLGAMTADELENPQEARALTEEISSTARELVGRLDEIVWAVDPKNDSLEGLSSYLFRYAQEFLGTARIRVRLDFPPTLPDCLISPDVRHHFLMAFKEGLNNLVKHASATECVIRMTVSKDSLNLLVQDDGHGFNESEHQDDWSHGLANMRNRMQAVKGQFRIESRTSQGTRLHFELPLTP